ncbi:MAG TPA: hypothetical protein VFI25_13765 [Planctomycetota bacterium]|jgi:DNA-binding beta-propeller fold protein YncE|nr:hypothetical protein [Planctomycetota bacterium]
MRRATWLPLVALFGLASASPAQDPSVMGAVNLSGLGNGAPAFPFGLSLAPDGSLWVAIAGSVFANNDVVARIALPTMAVVRPTVQVGLFPEEIAFTVDPAQPGVPRHAWVTVSSAGTIVRVGADPSLPDYLTVTDTVPFPSGPYGPFGIAVHPTLPRVYAGDFGGTGTVFAFDAVTAQILPAESLAVPGSHGRLAFAGNRLIVPATDFSGFPQTCVLVSGVDPSSPGGIWTRCLGCAGPGSYPSGQDVAASPAGATFVLPYDLGERSYLLDGASGTLVRTIQSGLGFAQLGIGISPDGALVAITDLLQNAVLFLDAGTHQRLAVVSMFPYHEPNDVVFVGDQLFVTAQASEAVVRIGNLPSHAPSPYRLTLAASDSTPLLGAVTTLTLTGGSVAAILVSTEDLPGPLGGGLALEIGPSFSLIAFGAGPSVGVSVPVPNVPDLRCANVFLQGVGLIGAEPATSNSITVIPQ